MEVKKYKCTECGLKAVIVKEKNHRLHKAECQDCETMTLKEIKDRVG